MKIKLYKDVVETLEDSKLNPMIKEDTFYLLQDLNNNIENSSTPKAMSYITNRSAYGVEHDGIHRFAIRRDKIYKVQRLYFYFEDDTVWFEKLVLKDKRKSQDKDIKYCINLRAGQ